MNDLEEAVFCSACAVGYPSLKLRGVPGRPQAEAKAGPQAWRKVAEWVARPGTDPQTIGAVIDAIDTEAKRLNQVLEGMFQP